MSAWPQALDPASEREMTRHVLRSNAVRRFMRQVLHIPPAPMVEAPGAGHLFGERVLLQMDAVLPLGNSSKVRNIAGVACSIAEHALAEGAVSDSRPAAADENGEQLAPEAYAATRLAALRAALDGATLVAASTGNHAYAVGQFARWLSRHGITVQAAYWVSRDITTFKANQLSALGAQVVRGEDFSDITRDALAFAAARVAAGQRYLFVPTDPVDQPWPTPRYNLKDGMPGFATAVWDTLRSVERLAGAAPMPCVRAMYLPTSGGATWSACLAYVRHVERHPQLVPLRARIGDVIAVDDEHARPVHASLTRGTVVERLEIDEGAPPINGLTQQSMSPYAFTLARLCSASPDGAVRPVSVAAAKLAQLLVLGETGVLPELAGAASLGRRVLEETVADRRGFALRLEGCLAAYGFSGGHLARVGLTVEELRGLGLEGLLGGKLCGRPAVPLETPRAAQKPISVYLVTGGNTMQMIDDRTVALLRDCGRRLADGEIGESLASLSCVAFVLAGVALKGGCRPSPTHRTLGELVARIDRGLHALETAEGDDAECSDVSLTVKAIRAQLRQTGLTREAGLSR